MTRHLKTIAASALIAASAFGATVLPASAGGQISIGIAPTNQEQADAMRAGLQIYSIVKGAQNGGLIEQLGNGNAAGLAQLGSGNVGVVHQDGNGHNGTVTQNGNNNAHGLFQFGENTDGHVSQNGGESGLTFQFGW
ncbi:curlin [Oricola sp.]|uniref:curlin n=1 Tax=Oricola sp. TaxID=1979950 RepID=UPI003BAD3641